LKAEDYHQDFARQALDEIRQLHSDILQAARTTLDKAIRIGELLTTVKAQCKHGEWLPWVQANLPFSERTAQNYMRAAEWCEGKSETVSHLPASTVYLLAAPSTSEKIKTEVKPHHVLLVVDAMTGQDALTVAERFNTAVGIDAIILTKMDGDSRGGAALSVRHVTGRPIAFVGVGEKTDALEPFHPDRVASRILGMGDVLSLVEKAQETVDRETAEALVKKLREDSFTLEDFRDQLRQVKHMGPLDQLLGMIPGLGKLMKGAAPKELDEEAADLGRFDAIISSMTAGERNHPDVINGSRRQRIARGSGTSVQDVNRLLKQYAQLRKMMKQFKGMEGRLGRMKGLPGLPLPRG
jgi:signal recognition particle subunit SRP54